MDPRKLIVSLPVENEPHAEYRRILQKEICDVSQVSIHPGKMVPEHVHDDAEQVYLVSSGSGIVILDGEEFEIQQGMAVIIPRGSRHSTQNTGEEPLIYTYVEAFYQCDD